MTAQTIPIDASLESILARAGLNTSTEWYHTPLDFVERSEFHGSVLFRYWINILKRMVPFRNKMSGYSVVEARQRRSDNDIIPFDDHWRYSWIEVIPTLPYIAINFVAWNFYFPTTWERWMWRGSSIAMAATFLIGAIIEVGFLQLWPASDEKKSLQRHRHEVEYQSTLDENQLDLRARFMSKMRRFGQAIRNNSFLDDPNLDVSIRLLIPATMFAAIYVVSRLYILAEDLAAFRSLPATAFDTVDWAAFIPHIG